MYTIATALIQGVHLNRNNHQHNMHCRKPCASMKGGLHGATFRASGHSIYILILASVCIGLGSIELELTSLMTGCTFLWMGRFEGHHRYRYQPQ